MEVINEVQGGLHTFDELKVGDVFVDREGEAFLKTDEEDWPLVSLHTGTLYHVTDTSSDRIYQRVVACIKLTGYLS